MRRLFFFHFASAKMDFIACVYRLRYLASFGVSVRRIANFILRSRISSAAGGFHLHSVSFIKMPSQCDGFFSSIFAEAKMDFIACVYRLRYLASFGVSARRIANFILRSRISSAAGRFHLHFVFSFDKEKTRNVRLQDSMMAVGAFCERSRANARRGGVSPPE